MRDGLGEVTEGGDFHLPVGVVRQVAEIQVSVTSHPLILTRSSFDMVASSVRSPCTARSTTRAIKAFIAGRRATKPSSSVEFVTINLP